MKIIREIYVATFLSVSVLSYAQDASTTIKVVDKQNNPLIGVKVALKDNMSNGSLTDERGQVSLDDTQKGDILIVQASDGSRKDIQVKEGMNVVVLDGRSKPVNRGFNLSGRNEESTAAVSTIYMQSAKTSDINPANSLYGKLTGLTSLQATTVAWSSDPEMFVRGTGTTGTKTPLILIDGFERPLSSLSQDEIESVTVLKDAASQALYGVRGANGVILVTTKRGEFSGMKVKASYQFGLNTPFRIPTMANGYQYAQAMNEALQMDGLAALYSQSDLAAFQSGTQPELFPSVNWADEVLKDKGTTHQFNASFTGGGKNIRYFAAINYIGDNGFMNTDHFSPDYSSQMEWDKLSARANLDINATKLTLIKLNLLGILSQHNRPATNYPTLFPMIYNVPSAAFPIQTSTGVWGGDNIRKNPVAESVATGFSIGNDRSLYADLRILQDLSVLTPGLSAELAIAYDNQASYWDSKTKNYVYESLQPVRDNGGNITDITRVRYGQETDLSFSSSLGSQSRVTTFEAKVNYEKNWLDTHQLNASVIYHQEENSPNGVNQTYRRQSYIGNVSYAYKNKYLADLVLTYSGSSVLGNSDKYAFFPAISAGWVISSEDFMQNATAINYLKARASWGITGSDRFAYDYDKYYFKTGTSAYYFGDNNNSASGHGEIRLPNLKLKPETASKFNFGIDMEVFNRLSLSADVFYEKRTNILVNSAPIYSTVLGVTTPMLNDGEVKNYGFEAGLSWNDRIGDFTYMLAGNFAFARNEIVNMDEGYQPYDYLKNTGNRIGQYYGLEAIGFFKDETDVANSTPQSFSKVVPGDVKYKDQNNDGVIDDYDKVAIGYSTILPEITYGFTIALGYKNLSLRADFQGVANYTLVKDMESMYWPLVGNRNVSQHYLENRWTPSTPDAMYPRLTTKQNDNNFRNSSIWTENGNFLKLRNLEIAYTLPKSWVNKIRLENINLFARGMNLFSVDHVKDMDPEQMYATYPSFRSYNIGLTLDF
ncbi:SusC/RagA family TonB-linked outer membrane protein [Parabacteroides faecis]|uniref:SusC/RagA family TonB-linked outer membrane protein n=1 Tax=Parabacteroides faecis TaxID=1217282 RepID=UPI002164DE11|nr:SusC/RagA family TonB-linked outer membrane protein [Parabacteroides faecis]UVQ46628.1 SusC/RagA family TonB-linked outer membrane protein [Parabacteroides faecis]